MFHPIGPQNPTVYWRRRLAVLGGMLLLVLLIVLTFNEMRSDGASPTASKTSSSPKRSQSTVPKAVAPTPSTSSAARSASAKTAGSSSKGSTKSPSNGPSTKPVTACVTKNLELRAVVAQSNYKVGDSPRLQLQVTNVGTVPCIQDLADKQVELRVYNGESRVWGSHDCKITPGSILRTLNPKVPVLVSTKWSGLSSQPQCAGVRQRVNAGTYTLYAALAGRTGKATQFSIG